jgi:hypothetical protein
LFKDHQVTPKDFARMMHDLMTQEHAASLQPTIDANAPTLAEDAKDEQGNQAAQGGEQVVAQAGQPQTPPQQGQP